METINCLVFEKIAFCVCILATDGQTDVLTDGQHQFVKALLAVASGGLNKYCQLV